MITCQRGCNYFWGFFSQGFVNVILTHLTLLNWSNTQIFHYFSLHYLLALSHFILHTVVFFHNYCGYFISCSQRDTWHSPVEPWAKTAAKHCVFTSTVAVSHPWKPNHKTQFCLQTSLFLYMWSCLSVQHLILVSRWQAEVEEGCVICLWETREHSLNCWQLWCTVFSWECSICSQGVS